MYYKQNNLPTNLQRRSKRNASGGSSSGGRFMQHLKQVAQDQPVAIDIFDASYEIEKPYYDDEIEDLKQIHKSQK